MSDNTLEDDNSSGAQGDELADLREKASFHIDQCRAKREHAERLLAQAEQHADAAEAITRKLEKVEEVARDV